MVRSFKQWFEEEYTSGQEFALTANAGSAYLDLETPTQLARVTLWEDGSCVMEAMSIQEGQYLYWQDFQFGDWPAARIAITAFVRNLGLM